mmetsp:Transcript_36602/g.37999  ORF Transcript_36602/g.37999 Transcript_36602/m.37999 type:complete len:80 (+) Transcript_36602:12-251(+)
MAQNNSLKLKTKEKKKQSKRNQQTSTEAHQSHLDLNTDKHHTVRKLKKEMKKSKGKVYKSIERTILSNAKAKREHFEIL